MTAPESSPVLRHYLGPAVAECGNDSNALMSRRPRIWVGYRCTRRDVIAGLSREAPECRGALQYRLVEMNEHCLAQSLAALTEGGLGDVVRGEEIPPGSDPEPITGVVVANEVADASSRSPPDLA